MGIYVDGKPYVVMGNAQSNLPPYFTSFTNGSAVYGGVPSTNAFNGRILTFPLISDYNNAIVIAQYMAAYENFLKIVLLALSSQKNIKVCLAQGAPVTGYGGALAHYLAFDLAGGVNKWSTVEIAN